MLRRIYAGSAERFKDTGFYNTTVCLADMGGDVLKIVSGSRPDIVDSSHPTVPETNLSALATQLKRGKRCMALNLKDPARRYGKAQTGI